MISYTLIEPLLSDKKRHAAPLIEATVAGIPAIYRHQTWFVPNAQLKNQSHMSFAKTVTEALRRKRVAARYHLLPEGVIFVRVKFNVGRKSRSERTE